MRGQMRVTDNESASHSKKATRRVRPHQAASLILLREERAGTISVAGDRSVRDRTPASADSAPYSPLKGSSEWSIRSIQR